MSLLINASIKKSGTTFIHNLFAENVVNVPNLAVPPIKEWYFFPTHLRTSFNYLNLSERASQKLKELDMSILENQGTDSKMYDFLFAEKLASEKRLRESLVALSKSSHPDYASLVMTRALNLIDTYPTDSTFLLSDPNFLNDFSYFMDSKQQKDVGAELARKKTFFFSVVRKPHQAALSLLKERHVRGTSPAGDETQYPTIFDRQVVFPQLSALLKNGLCDNILLVDMDYLTKSTTIAFDKICAFAGLSRNKTIHVPENPNPARVFPTEMLKKAEKTFENMFESSHYKKFYRFVEESQFSLLSLNGSGLKLQRVDI